ncbi:MAG: metalloregulator ArsR/SmtB family transcription factor [Proteobacteria bacterium]|nr:metalloregulator ArsR/SmtB family transcription factor [Pseudomonadota bacterium]MCL2308297.1 metalloregulator ArsR/SmtB family transcription factor [Pseudomonadota bacterium]
MTQTLLTPPQMKAQAEKAVSLLKLLGNEDRLLLLCQIAQGEVCVGRLEDVLKIGQPTLSQQLGVLRRAGLVVTRKEGKQVYYRMADESAIAVINTLYGLYCNKPENNHDS